jgi:hypothetical protein
MFTQGKTSDGVQQKHLRPDEQPSYVNLRWHTFPDDVVQRLNPRRLGGDDVSRSGCGCGGDE